MSTEIEQRLTEALAAGADAITRSNTSEPTMTDWQPPRTVDRRTDHRRRTPFLLVAAAATIVGAVAALAVFVRPDASRPAAPHHTSTLPSPAPSTSRTAAPNPQPRVVNGIHAPTCVARQTDPVSHVLKQVLTSGVGGSYDFAGLPILSVTTDGDVLAGTVGSKFNPGRLDLIRPNGSRTTLYRASDVPLDSNQNVGVSAAQGDKRWIVFAVSVMQGQGDVVRLGLVDRRSGVVTVFRTLPAFSSTIILPPVLYDGRPYWTEVYSAGTDSVFTYDAVSRRIERLSSGSQLGAPAAIGGGLYWQRDGRVVAYRHGTLPAGFPSSLVKFPPLAGDGKTTVWTTTADPNGRLHVLLELGQAGMATALTLVDSTTADTIVPLAVAGPYVFWNGGTSFTMLDTRTGATAKVGFSDPFSTIAAGGGTLAVNQIGSKGGARLSVARITDLPELTC
jgi:hypothetical protein